MYFVIYTDLMWHVTRYDVNLTQVYWGFQKSLGSILFMRILFIVEFCFWLYGYVKNDIYQKHVLITLYFLSCWLKKPFPPFFSLVYWLILRKMVPYFCSICVCSTSFFHDGKNLWCGNIIQVLTWYLSPWSLTKM